MHVQKLALVSVLPDIWSATYGQTPAMPPLAAAPAAGLGSRPGAGIKREGEPLAVQPDVKRPRSAEVQRKIDGLFKLCQAIVAKKLWAAKNATWFKEPVNPAIAPNYYHYIKRPMDLGTIKKRLQDSELRSMLRFHAGGALQECCRDSQELPGPGPGAECTVWMVHHAAHWIIKHLLP